MKTIKFLKDAPARHGPQKAGAVVTLRDSEADRLVKAGAATYCDAAGEPLPPPPPESKP